jgi:hypothetical protein
MLLIKEIIFKDMVIYCGIELEILYHSSVLKRSFLIELIVLKVKPQKQRKLWISFCPRRLTKCSLYSIFSLNKQMKEKRQIYKVIESFTCFQNMLFVF